MKLEVLAAAMTDAMILSGNGKTLAEIIKDLSADNIERVAKYCPNSNIKYGLMYYSDVLRYWGLRPIQELVFDTIDSFLV